MRSRHLRSLLAGLLLAPLAPTLAQEAQEEAVEEGSETEGADVVDPPEAPARVPGGRRSAAPGAVHTVERGDTLWDLSQRYLGTPWYWPKVWAYNPSIANPHWIYPGNLVRLAPAGEEGVAPGVAGGAVEPLEAAGGELEASAAGLDEAPLALEPQSGEELVEVSGRIGLEPRAAGRRVVHQGFVTRRELDEAGTIESSFSEALMLSYPDTVYVRFRNPGSAKVGDRYVIFRTQGEVDHPVTGERVGFLTHFLGTLRVVALSRGLVTAQLGDTWDEVTRGDLVGPGGEKDAVQVQERPNEKEVRGVVVTALVPYLTIFGEHHELVLDVGGADGVQPGNTFSVVRQQDLGGNFMNPAEGQDPELPLEEVARCMVVDVKEHTSNCLMTRSIREVVPGDRVWMRPAGAPTARR